MFPTKELKFYCEAVKVSGNLPIEELIDKIDWNPFFAVWQLRGKYPNRSYPKIFNDPTVGNEARKVFDEAIEMIHHFRELAKKGNCPIKARGVIGFFPANSVKEDIQIYLDEGRTESGATLFGLRQQTDKESDEPYLAFGDFVAPKNSGIIDYLGLFAVSAGFGVEEQAELYAKEHDDYNIILLKAVADRLAEAFAEKLHEDVRRNYWGYAKSEALSSDDLFRVKYQGIRPAPGYPSQPDHTEKRTIWNLLKVQETTGIQLTESMAMLPGASVCGIYFGNREARYFNVGKITKEQAADYAARKGVPVSEAESWLSSSLSYDKD